MGHPNTVIVIATYNEAETIGSLLTALADYRVIVIDDDSPDGTAQIARQFPNTHVIVRQNERGIASAYLYGFDIALRAGYARIVQMDAGWTHDPADVPEMLNRAWRADLLIGSRFVIAPHALGLRTLISLGAAALMRLKGVSVQDATSGFRVWHADVLRKAIERGVSAKGFAFQLELLWNAYQLGAIIREYPIKYCLTNSSFKPQMLIEALRVYWRLT